MTDDFGDRLQRFLASRDERYASAVIDEVTPMGGGYSRAMHRVKVAVDGRPEQLIVRSDPPPGQAMIETDRAHEWRILQALRDAHSVHAPNARWFDAQGEICDVPSLVLDFVEGTPWSALGGERDPANLAEQLGRMAARVHAVPLDTLGPIELPASWDDYVDSRISALRAAERAFPQPDPVLRFAAAWLDANRPPPLPLTLVHGDFQVPNVLVRADDELALLDWELSRIGDPREDLGYLGFVGALSGEDPIAGRHHLVHEAYRDATGLGEAVDQRSIAFFTIVSAIDGLRRVMDPLGAAMRAGDVPTALAYAAIGLTALHGVLLQATTTEAA